MAESADDYAEGGRGLVLVGFASEEWGVHRSAEGGKVVWARLTQPGVVAPRLPEEVLTPLPYDGLDAQGAALGAKLRQADIALMRRVLDELPRLPELRFAG